MKEEAKKKEKLPSSMIPLHIKQRTAFLYLLIKTHRFVVIKMRL